MQLGATKPDGLPLDLFSSGDARWLGETVNGGQEQPRVLLLSVPYALKAADAETLGGRPVSAFMMAPPSVSGGRQQGSLAEQANEIICLSGTACKTGFVPLFSSNGGSAKVSNSIISQSGATIGIAGSENVNGSINSGANLSASGNVSANGNVGASTMTAGASSNTIVATMSGNTPQTSAITGVATATGIGNTYGVAGYSSTGNGVGVFGQVNGGGTGLYGVSTGGVGVFGSGPAFGFQTDSNVQQARNAGGWVKAMVYVNAAQPPYTIIRCFNSTLAGAAATTPPCGFNLTELPGGVFDVTFGFEIDDRFWSATSGLQNLLSTGSVAVILNADSIGSQDIYVYPQDINGKPCTAYFNLIVY